MQKNFVGQIGYPAFSEGNVHDSLFKEYEHVVIQSLVTSFGLDFLVQDRLGGDVDTIHNVRQIEKNGKMSYKNAANEKAYENLGNYNSGIYHSAENFRKTKHDARKKYYESYEPLQDEYTDGSLHFTGKSKNASPRIKAELDHVIAAKSIHEDRGRVLSGLNGVELADSLENFSWTNKSMNASMAATDIPEYIAEHPDLPEETKSKMMNSYNKAKKSYDAKLNYTYYTSKKFYKDTATVAGKVGISMGLRQALGLVFTEIWFTVRDVILENNKDGELLFHSIAKGIKQGLKNAKNKFRELWAKFIEGSIAGVLSSLVTTLENMFFTTAKNIIKIVRQTWASFVEACKILFVNPECLPLEGRISAAAKVLATGASIVAGFSISEFIGKTPFGVIPVIGDIVQTFCGILVTGILSCSFLYILDTNSIIKKSLEMLSKIPTIENFSYSLKQQAEILERYLAELMELDYELLEKQTQMFKTVSLELENAKTEPDTNSILKNIYAKMNIDLPWKGYSSFDGFMKDKNSVLRFG